MIKQGDVVAFLVPYDTGYAFAPEGYETTALTTQRWIADAVMVEMIRVPGVTIRQYVTADSLTVVAKAGGEQ